MSVILTAGKKSILASKPKSAKKKKAKRSAPAFPAGPPVSTPQMTVWYFTLDDMECTVMFNKHDMSVWCNGDDLETVDGFSGNGMDGSVIDFYITLDDNSCHRGRIECVRNEKALNHTLEVNGYTVTARTYAGQSLPRIPGVSQQQQQQQQQQHPQYNQQQSSDQNAHGSMYSGYNGEGSFDGGNAMQQQQQQQQQQHQQQAGYYQSYNQVEQGAYGGYCNGPPPEAVYEPPPQYDDVVKQTR